MHKLLLAAFIAAQSADTASTAAKLSTGRFYEANPLLPRSTTGIVITKAAVAGLSSFLAVKLDKTHPKLAHAILWVGIGSGTYGAVSNLTK